MIGTKVQLRTKEYVVPSLTLGEVMRFTEDGTLAVVPQHGLTLLALPDTREPLIRVVLEVLRHNYPEITREEILDEIDVDNAERVIAVMLGASRLLKKEKGEGEAQPQIP